MNRPSMHISRTDSGRDGFTLIELLIVITIISLATIIALPAFARLIASTNYASAVNSVTSTLGNARALAIRNGRNTGVAFLYDVGTQEYSLIVLELESELSGRLAEFDQPQTVHTIGQVFRPALNTAPVKLPPGTAVFGLSFSIAPRSGEGSDIDPETAHWYSGALIDEGNNNEIVPWLFPRNDPRHFVDAANNGTLQDVWGVLTDQVTSSVISLTEAREAVRHASSFFIQFDTNGSVVTSTPTQGGGTVNSYIEWPERPVDLDDPGEGPYDDAKLFDPEFIPSGVGRGEANPEVVLRSVSQLAVVNMRDLITGVARDERFATLNLPPVRQPWFVQSSSSRAPRRDDPSIRDYEQAYYNDDVVEIMSDWIDNNAEVIAFNRYTGNVIRRKNP